MTVETHREYVGYLDERDGTERLTDEEIVRCRDCKMLAKMGNRVYCGLNAGGFPEVELDGFCAWGERRDA